MPTPTKFLRTLLTLAALAAAGARADEAPPLTLAGELLSLTADEARRSRPVAVTGVVTAAEHDWRGQFFVQDATGGVFVENFTSAAPSVGDLVRVEGVSHPGSFAPIIGTPRWTKLGTAPLPEPRRVAIEDLQAGHEDSQRVEVEGIVRAAWMESGWLLIDLSVVGNRLQVRSSLPQGWTPAALTAARVRVRGTAAMRTIGALRHMTAAVLYVPRTEDLIVLEPEKVDPFTLPATPLNNIAQYRRHGRAEERVHLRGTVTLQRTGGDIYIQDETAGLHLVAKSAPPLAPGVAVEVAGFVEYEGHLPILRDAMLRLRPEPPRPVAARAVPFGELMRGEHHAALITLRGKLLDRATRPAFTTGERPRGFVTTWLVQGEETTFTIEHESAEEDPALALAPLGSVIEADGVCISSIDAAARLISLRLFLPSLDGMRIIRRPSWFTPARLFTGLAILGAGLLGTFAWLLTIAKKNAALHRAVRALQAARAELQQAHDTLEQKVAERSAQLQVEMTARKTAEVQFKAVLAERTRLARDLHDTLEQTLAGIALRLNAAAKLSRRDPEASDSHLQLARNWLHQSQVGLRRSIWDLRSRELEQFDLGHALRWTADQLVHGTEIALDFRTSGTAPKLPEIVEENVLRIGQEALTNIAKHARATRIGIHLEFPPSLLRLTVEDDGAGFDPAQPASEGHFGLTGIAERAKRIAGGVSIASTPGRGTRIVLEVPLDPPAGGGAEAPGP